MNEMIRRELWKLFSHQLLEAEVELRDEQTACSREMDQGRKEDTIKIMMKSKSNNNKNKYFSYILIFLNVIQFCARMVLDVLLNVHLIRDKLILLFFLCMDSTVFVS